MTSFDSIIHAASAIKKANQILGVIKIGGRCSKTSIKTCTTLVRETIRGTGERTETTIHGVPPEAR